MSGWPNLADLIVGAGVDAPVGMVGAPLGTGSVTAGRCDEAPALLMRNTTDDPTWTAFIYHDHVSWFPGAAYVVEKLFREHFAETYLASTSGTGSCSR